MPDGGVVGDPYVLAKDGTTYEFSGLPGSMYMMATDGTTKVAFRIANVPGSLTKTMVDQVTIKTGTHLLVVGLSTATLDGVSLTFGVSPSPISTGTCQWHTGVGGEKRVDFKMGSWGVAVIQDPGTSMTLHGPPSPLHNVLHLGLFVDSMPSTGVTGVMVSGGPLVAVINFHVTIL